jgi:hypothetical protein
MCAFAHFWMDSLRNGWKHSSAWATCISRAHVRVYTMRALRESMHCTHHCTHVRARTLLDGFSPTLVDTFLGSQKLACLTLFLRARLRLHVMHVRARTCAHVCFCTLLDVFALNLVDTFVCMGYMFCICALVCAHYARTMRVHALHACARSHFLNGFSSNWVEHDTGPKELHVLNYFYVRAMRMRAHTRAHMCVRNFGIDSLQNWWTHFSACTTFVLRARMRVHNMCALCA